MLHHLGTIFQKGLDALPLHVRGVGILFGRAAAAPLAAPQTKFTNETLRAAVQLWCSDRAAALARYGPIGEWDTSGVTDMRKLFNDKRGFNDDISGWVMSGVTDTSWMFDGATSFNQPLDKWVVSSVKTMSRMFSGAAAFNQPLDKWDVSKVKDMNSMFDGATSFDQPKTLRRFVRPCARRPCARTRAYANKQPHAHRSLGTSACCALLTPARESTRCCDLHASFTRLQAEWEKLNAQLVAQLKELCALHGLRKTGLKSELVARLLDALCT